MRICFISLACLALASASTVAAADPVREPDALTVDGGRYFGPVVDGRLHGEGRLEWDNGSSYEGAFRDGLFEGQGRFRYPSGEVYEGTFRSGLMAGDGVLRDAEGSTYSGAFHNNEFHGLGRYETPDGEVYEGQFDNGRFQGQGHYADADRNYRGEFKRWRFWGQGVLEYKDGTRYRGEFANGGYHGKGRLEKPSGEVYDGQFDNGEFKGKGSYTDSKGMRYEGEFAAWLPHGAGRYTAPDGSYYEGKFVDGRLEGPGRFEGPRRVRYEGGFKNWLFEGVGELRLPNGDVYRGGFARGEYEGEGTLTYAKPRPDGRTEDKGIWRYGELPRSADDARRAQRNVEAALYGQRRLLDEALRAVAPSDPDQIDLYFLGVAGDGSQEVFRREVEYVRDQFVRSFGAEGRVLTLINSRNTVDTAPMATVTSVREALATIAARMDKDNDILFVFLSSHGSKEHDLVLNQERMDLRGLPAAEMGELLRESGIRWKVVVVSACYSGGFIEPLKDERTLVITAARHDRRSFGCDDENEFTYFGEAYFKDALPRNASFQAAFEDAARAVHERELSDRGQSNLDEEHFSLPQMHTAEAIEAHLRRWRAQAAGR